VVQVRCIQDAKARSASLFTKLKHMCFYQNLCEIYLKDMLDFAKNTTTFFLVANVSADAQIAVDVIKGINANIIMLVAGQNIHPLMALKVGHYVQKQMVVDASVKIFIKL
jgi:hypothetical protein